MVKPFEVSSKLFKLMVYKTKGTATSTHWLSKCNSRLHKSLLWNNHKTTSIRVQTTWKKDHEIFIDDNKWKIYGICLLDTYSCIDSSAKPCTVLGATQNSAAAAICVKKIKEKYYLIGYWLGTVCKCPYWMWCDNSKRHY